MTFAYRNSSITQQVKPYANHRRIDFDTVVDWHEHHRLLKTCFDVEIHATQATYDI